MPRMILGLISAQDRPARHGQRVKTRLGFMGAKVEAPDNLSVLPQRQRTRLSIPFENARRRGTLASRAQQQKQE